MRRPRDAILLLAVFLFVLGLGAFAAAAPPEAKESKGTVTLPLSRWRALEDDLDAPAPPHPAAEGVSWVARRIEGRFRKGLWTGRLVARFDVLPGGPVRVPVLDHRAVLGEVTLDGEPAALLEDGERYALPLDRAGRHELTVDFHWGRETERFTRTLDLRLPEGGPVALEARIAERGITPTLAGGALTSFTEQGGDTVVTGHLDGSGELRLSWKQSASSEPRGEARIEAREHTLFRVSEALVTGQSRIDLHVLEGETDTIRLSLPPGVEVLRVEGDAVLQWHPLATEKEGRVLVVLLRHLVADEARIRVDFQLANQPQAPIELVMPLPSAPIPTVGSLGVLGPPGLRLDPRSVEAAERLAPREIPEELQALGTGPVLFGYRFDKPPRIVLSASPLPELELARTVVDELSASTVVLGDGTERTKVALRIRNDGRQYVELALPEGARPLRSFIDGREVRPALLGQRLLLPLRQSERLAADQTRIHTVRAGETLSDVANLYYADPSAWQRISAKNRAVIPENGSLVEGTRLEIPPAAEATKEAFFVIEVAYERPLHALGAFGMEKLRLPGLDVDTTKAVWHVYFPSSHEPLEFRGNLRQASRIKYDPFRRLQWYLQSALGVSTASAGGYENILQKRRAIYNDEATGGGEPFAALTEFPLVGERYRFRRILLGREIPEITVVYASNGLLSWVRHGALVAAFVAAVFALRRRGRAPLLVLVATLVLLLCLAHFVPSIHRRILWGLDFALFLVLARRAWPRVRRLARAFARAPWLFARMITARRLVAAAGFSWLLGELAAHPMLLSLAALLSLSAVWFRLRILAERRRSRHAT
ncbi:LysM peptidoglycan-binding domain-containing protein [Polyangium sorediatum]|uniref:LysM domain-containing protein n=1 Tax=Polyangium sorediatum TaxID=889274 RepID=A0ABT6P7Q9_9BACT|nr:LysM domain-containing protein [Polyangium sorediatum]MDI1436613.1 LysM domain-containing protein [Polyangium sorediatum]